MTVSFNWSTEFEQTLRQKAESSGLDLESFVRQIVTESFIDDVETPLHNIDSSEFVRRMDAWIALHPVLDHAIDRLA